MTYPIVGQCDPGGASVLGVCQMQMRDPHQALLANLCPQ